MLDCARLGCALMVKSNQPPLIVTSPPQCWESPVISPHSVPPQFKSSPNNLACWIKFPPNWTLVATKILSSHSAVGWYVMCWDCCFDSFSFGTFIGRTPLKVAQAWTPRATVSRVSSSWCSSRACSAADADASSTPGITSCSRRRITSAPPWSSPFTRTIFFATAIIRVSPSAGWGTWTHGPAWTHNPAVPARPSRGAIPPVWYSPHPPACRRMPNSLFYLSLPCRRTCHTALRWTCPTSCTETLHSRAGTRHSSPLRYEWASASSPLRQESTYRTLRHTSPSSHWSRSDLSYRSSFDWASLTLIVHFLALSIRFWLPICVLHLIR